MKSIPTAITAERARATFLESIKEKVRYWSSLPDMTQLERCDGVAFSILCILDGVADLPAMDIALHPHQNDKQFRIDNGDDWYEPGMAINSSNYLHDEYASMK